MVTLIKHGMVLDGTGAPAVKCDLLIRSGRIVRIGSLANAAADEVIDAVGNLVTPGFIDAGSHADRSGDLFTPAGSASLITQGITSVIGGQCGWSFAPWRTPTDATADVWRHPTNASVVWPSILDLFRFLERMRLGVNFGTLVGSGALRLTAQGTSTCDATERDQRTFAHLLIAALREGALGLSVGYGGDGVEFLSQHSLESVARIVARAGGVIAVHLGAVPRALITDAHAVLEVSRAARVAVLFSHLTPRVSDAHRYGELLTILEHVAGQCDVHFDIQPLETTQISLKHLVAASTDLHASPDPLRPRSEASERARRSGPDFRALAAHLPLGIVIDRVFDRSLQFLEGKTIDALAETRNRSPLETLGEVVRITRGNATVLVRDVASIPLAAYLSSSRALVATQGRGYRRRLAPHEVQSDIFTAFLRWAASSGRVPLEAAVQRLTGSAARVYHLRHRGVLREGSAADVLVLDPETLRPSYVFVNGVCALRMGTLTGVCGGQVLRRDHR
ncbi:MAG: amidohydrolase family protein [bacterium]|nr:amidohydrolase family protein [bacterium]